MVTLCPGYARKLALPFIALTAVGWVVLVIGSAISVANDKQSNSAGGAYPLFYAVIGGFFALIALVIHPIFPRPYSVIIGAFTSVLTVMWVLSLGMVLFGTGNSIRNRDRGVDSLGRPSNDTIEPYLTLEFSGCVIATFFIIPVMMLWFFFDGTTNYKETNTPFEGVARKIAMPFVFLTAISWLLLVIGFGIGSNKSVFDVVGLDAPLVTPIGTFVFDERGAIFIVLQDPDEPPAYAYLIICVTGPLVFITAVLHALFWKPISNIIGAILGFLNALFLTGLGMAVALNGIRIQRNRNGDMYHAPIPGFPPPFDEPPEIPDYYILEFVGALLAIIFWSPVVILWNFYDGIDGATGSLDIKGRTDVSNEVETSTANLQLEKI